jgi:hypothetical protein
MRKKIMDLVPENLVHRGEDPDQIRNLFIQELKFREHHIGILGNQLLQVLNKEAQEENKKESKK